MRLPASLSCAFCASIFSLSAWGYTITSATATVKGNDKSSQPFFATCNSNNNIVSDCELGSPQYNSYAVVSISAGAGDGYAGAGGMAGSIYSGTGAYGLATGTASASFFDTYEFTAEDGQVPATQVLFWVIVSGHVHGSLVGGAFDGYTFYEDGYSAHGLIGLRPIIIPYNGTPFDSDGTLEFSLGSDDGYISYGDALIKVQSITMLDAAGNPVAGTLRLVPEPAYWPVVAFVIGFAAIARLKPGRFRV